MFIDGLLIMKEAFSKNFLILTMNFDSEFSDDFVLSAVFLDFDVVLLEL